MNFRVDADTLKPSSHSDAAGIASQCDAGR